MENKGTMHKKASVNGSSTGAKSNKRKAGARRRLVNLVVLCSVFFMIVGLAVFGLSGDLKKSQAMNDEETVSEAAPDGAAETADVPMAEDDVAAEDTVLFMVEEDAAAEEDIDTTDGLEINYDKIKLTGEEVFAGNIFVDNKEVSGLSYGEADELIKAGFDERTSKELTLTISKDAYTYTVSELGGAYDLDMLENALKQAIVYGNHGSLLTKYKENTTLREAGKSFDIDFSIDEEKITDTIKELSESYTGQQPKNAQIHMEGGSLVVTEEVRGIGVDVEKTAEMIINNLNNWDGENIDIEAEVVETLPRITADDLNTIKDVLGSYRTDFHDDTGSGRGANLKNGTQKLNDRLLMPGETLSVYDCLAPFTVSNGYRTATAYANGGYVDSIGGGICQIATTFYNACLEAELDIVKRSNHSMVVSYVDRGFDSTINDNGSKDLVIRNNYDTPIYIAAYLSNMQVCTYIYGADDRNPNRKVTYYSVVLSESMPSESEYVYTVITPGNAKYSEVNGRVTEGFVGPDEILMVQDNYPSCKAQLYKKVVVNGEVVENKLLHTDTYRSSPAKFLVGANYPYPGKPADVVETTPENPEGGESQENPSQAEGGETTVPAPENPAPENPAPEQAPQGGVILDEDILP